MDRVRASGPFAMRLDLSSREWIALDVSRDSAGLWLIPRGVDLPADPREPEGQSKQAVLLFRKHVVGAVIEDVVDAPGRGALLRLRTREASLEAHARFRAPGAVTLRRGPDVVATFGPGAAALVEEIASTPEPASTDVVARARRYAELRGRSLLGERLKEARSRAKAEVSRLERLQQALERDRSRWPDTEVLRRDAEALLASGVVAEAGAAEVVVADPRGGSDRRVALKRGVSVAKTADALFKRARAIEGRRGAFDARFAGVARDLASARAELDRLASVHRLEDAPPSARATQADRGRAAGPWRFLTSRGLPVWVGRTAAENHELTFAKARPEDVWLHALESPGAHVILRNLDGRATAGDVAEAAAVAAWHSERRSETAVDVQHCARKHVHPAKGGRGRVLVTHREVVRIAPRDPRGWLRRR